MKKNLLLSAGAATLAVSVLACAPAQAAGLNVSIPLNTQTTNGGGLNANIDPNTLLDPTASSTPSPTTSPSTAPLVDANLDPNTGLTVTLNTNTTPQPTSSPSPSVSASTPVVDASLDPTTGLTVNLNPTPTSSTDTSTPTPTPSTDPTVTQPIVNVPVTVNLPDSSTPTPTASTAPVVDNTTTNTTTNNTTINNNNTTINNPAPTQPNPATSTTPTNQPTPEPVQSTTPPVTTTPAAPAVLHDLMLASSTPTVYPVKDGYRDSVTFAIAARDGVAKPVGVQGRAVLSRAGKTVKTWNINGATKKLTWNGRIGKAIRAGKYTLKVTAWSADGTTKTTTTTVTVMPHHLVKVTKSLKTKVKANAVTAKMPKVVAQAINKGKVTVKIRTVAVVVKKAALVFRNKNIKRILVLRNGTHTSQAMTVPHGFKQVTIQHKWKKGTARLVSMRVIWTYNKLVK